jgi:GTP cyclohydrolase II
LFRELLYDDEHRESIALVMGQVEAGQDVLCRVHSHYLGAHVFNSVACDGREQMVLAQALIAHEGRGHGYLALMRSRALQAQGWSQTKAYRKLGYAADARQYTSAAGIPLTGTHPLAVDPGTNERLRRRYAEKVQ